MVEALMTGGAGFIGSNFVRHALVGHADWRVTIDTTKLRSLGWQPREAFNSGLQRTVAWYRENEWWWRPIKQGDPAFRAYYDRQYANREEGSLR
jgi:dTDP-D-glucose 4,6-dehydratase